MNGKIRFVKTLEFRPRSFDSKEKASQSFAKRLGAGIYSMLQLWTGYNDQICIKTIKERKVIDHGIERIAAEEQIISTGITKAMLEKFGKDELSGEDSNQVIKVLGEATDQNLSDLNKQQIQDLIKLILTFPDKLDFIKTLLQSPNVTDLLPAFADNTKLLINLDPTILNQIIAIDQAIPVIKVLSEYPMWKLKYLSKLILTSPDELDFIKSIMQSPKVADLLSAFEDNRFLIGLDFTILNQIIAIDQAIPVIRMLGRYTRWQLNDLSELILTSPDKLDFIKTLLQSPKAADLLRAFADNTGLLIGLDSTILNQIIGIDKAIQVVSVLGRYPLWQLDRDLLKEILKMPKPHKRLLLLSNFPRLGANFLPVIQKTLSMPLPFLRQILKRLDNFPLDFLQQSPVELWDKILASSEPDGVIIALGDHPELLQNAKLTLEHWDKILSFEPAKVLKHLIERPHLLQDSVFLDNMLQSKNLLQTLAWMRWGTYITVSSEGYRPEHSNLPAVYLNKDLFFEPPSDEWNILPQREGPIKGAEWDIIQRRLTDIFDTVYKERDNERDRLFRFLAQCMGTKDAETPAGKQQIRKRVEAVVLVLEKYLIEMNETTNNERKETIKKNLIGRTLDIMAMGGSTCPDNAIVLLRQAENHIKLFENPQYLPHIIVNMYKLHCIMERLTDPDNAENVETYLAYILNLSSLLGLGISGGMLYEEHYGKTEPFEKALPLLSKGFTAEKLIKFTTELEEFRSRFDVLKETTLKAKQEEYMATYDWEDEVKAEVDRKRINGELKDIENTFLTNTARQLFIDAGFLKAK